MYKGNAENSGKGKIVYNTGIVKGIVRLAVEDVAGVAIKDKKSSKKNISLANAFVKRLIINIAVYQFSNFYIASIFIYNS